MLGTLDFMSSEHWVPSISFLEHSLDKTAEMATNDTKMVKTAMTTMKHTNRDKAFFTNM